MFKPCNVAEHLGHFDSIVPSLACILTKQQTPLKNPWRLLISKMSLDASALKNLYLWCDFRLLPIISLLPKNFLTALRKLWRQITQSWVETVTATDTSTNTIGKYRQQHGVLLSTWNNSFWNSDEEHTYRHRRKARESLGPGFLLAPFSEAPVRSRNALTRTLVEWKACARSLHDAV